MNYIWFINAYSLFFLYIYNKIFFIFLVQGVWISLNAGSRKRMEEVLI